MSWFRNSCISVSLLMDLSWLAKCVVICRISLVLKVLEMLPLGRVPLMGTGPPGRLPLMGTGPPGRVPVMGTGPPGRLPLMGIGPPGRLPLMGTGPPGRVPLMGTWPPGRLPLTGTGPPGRLPLMGTGPPGRLPLMGTGPPGRVLIGTGPLGSDTLVIDSEKTRPVSSSKPISLLLLSRNFFRDRREMASKD